MNPEYQGYLHAKKCSKWGYMLQVDIEPYLGPKEALLLLLDCKNTRKLNRRSILYIPPVKQVVELFLSCFKEHQRALALLFDQELTRAFSKALELLCSD